MRTNPEIDFPHIIVDPNEAANADPFEDIYAMTDDEFETHLAKLHAEKLAAI